MKRLILILIFLAPVFVFSQTRIRDLTTQATYDGSAYVPLDKTGFTTTKKIALSVITGAEAALRANNDTLTRRAVGISDSGYYITDESTNYLTNAIMSTYDTNSVMTALHILDSVIFNKTDLFEPGAGTNAVAQGTSVNDADGTTSIVFNESNATKKTNSVAMGYNAVANYYGALAIGGGTYMTDYGANMVNNFVARGETTSSTSDTIEIVNQYQLVLPNDVMCGYEVTIVGVQTGGASGAEGNGFYQKWSGLIRNSAGTTAFVGTADSTTAKRSEAGMGQVSVTANDTYETLDIIVVGGAGRNYAWTAYCRFVYTGFRNFTLGY